MNGTYCPRCKMRGTGKHTCQPAVSGNTLREDECQHVRVSAIYVPPGGRWVCDACGQQFQPVLAVAAPHMDAAETTLGKVRSALADWQATLATEAQIMTTAQANAYRSCVAQLSAALASAEATADTQGDVL